MSINDNELELLNSEEVEKKRTSLIDLIHNTLDKYYKKHDYSVYFQIISPENQRILYNEFKNRYNLNDREVEKAMRLFERENKKYYRYYKKQYNNRFEIKKLKWKIFKLLIG